MPKINDLSMEERALPTTAFGYSATRLDALGAAEYTLVTLAVDVSGSVGPYAADMEQAIREVVNACKLSPRADNLMLRMITFNDHMREVHGFKLLANCNLDDYRGCLSCGGMTALFDAAEHAVHAQADYARTLVGSDYAVNGVAVIISDGCDNASAGGPGQVRAQLERAIQSEALESQVSILVGVGVGNDPQVSGALVAFQQEAGIGQYVETKDASARTLAKLAAFVSKSISAQSQALGTGGPSQPMSFSL
ncbi:MAG: vWA domain-containing protein [bacterium]